MLLSWKNNTKFGVNSGIEFRILRQNLEFGKKNSTFASLFLINKHYLCRHLKTITMFIQKKWGVLLILIAGWLQGYADEGMWIVNELNTQSLARMKELGFAPDYQYIYNKDAPCLANAVVIFGGGCTGITVSEEGLIFTNHHCGYGAIQQLSSVEHNYLDNGFVSNSQSEELPVDGLSVYYLKETIDVTDSILPYIADIEDEYRRIRAADSIGEILQEAMEKDRFIKTDVMPF